MVWALKCADVQIPAIRKLQLIGRVVEGLASWGDPGIYAPGLLYESRLAIKFINFILW